MTMITTVWPLETETLNKLCEPRTDILIEKPNGDKKWNLEKGPFSKYSRKISVDQNTQEITETTEFKLAVPFWWPYLTPLIKKQLTNLDRQSKQRWWWPKEVVSSRTSTLIASLAALSAISGYLGAVLGQTIAFIGKDFSVSEQDQASGLAWIRVGIIITLFILPRADKVGRRPLLIWITGAAILLTLVSGFAQNIETLIVLQALARAFVTALFSLAVLAVLEEVPAGWRASGLTVMALAAGFGSAVTMFLLPLIDIKLSFWRILYFTPILLIPIMFSATKKLPETKRFLESTETIKLDPKSKKNLILVATVLFCLSFFFTPVSQLRNTFLLDLDYSASTITAFQGIISLPATAAIIYAGVLADRKGRKFVGVTAIVLAVILSVVSYQTTGIFIWIAAGLALTASGTAFPAIYGYKTELFPTRLRAKINSYLDVIIVAGSGLGLAAASLLIKHLGGIGYAVAALSALPIVALIVFAFFLPETSNVELEDLNDLETLEPDKLV